MKLYGSVHIIFIATKFYIMQKTNTSAFITVVSVFFFFGLTAVSGDVLVPIFKEHFNLVQWEAQLYQVAYYGSFAIGSATYYVLSKITGKDLLIRLGYKNGMALGLIISAIGTLLFYPAANNASLPLFLSAIFIVGIGISLQQTVANPLAINLGDPKTSSQRLSLAGGVNNIGSTIGPAIFSFIIFGSLSTDSKLESLDSLKIPYLVLGLGYFVTAIVFKFSSIPDQITPEEIKADELDSSERKSALKYPQLVLGMLAIFLYVGVEASTSSNLPEYLRQHLNISTHESASYLSLFWASLMIGRWVSAVGSFNLSNVMKRILTILMPYVAFGIFLLANFGHDLQSFYIYPIVIAVIIIADAISKGNPVRQLMLYSSLGILALLIGIFSNGIVSAYAFISVGLFCSTLWPCIYTLAIAGLGKHTNDGSSFLVMMIMGGGIISWLQGYLSSDNLLGIHHSYIVEVFCFAYLMFYGWKAKSILKAQGITYDTSSI